MSQLYHSALILILTSLTGLVSSLVEEEKKATFLTANVGDSIAFNCPLDFPQDIAIPYVLQWNKESKTVFSRYDGGTLTAEEPYEHRVGLLTDNSQFGKGSINLTSVRESDAGWYECRVSFPYRTPSSRPNGTWFHLTVEGGDLLAAPPMNQTTLEGESAHFPCVTKDREAVIEWYKDGVSITQLNELSERSWIGPEGSLTLSPTIMSDLGQFQCQVTNKEGEKQTASAFLDVQYKAKVVYAPQEVFLPYGRPGILDCHFRANPPLTKLRWEKDGFLFDPFNVQGVFNRRNGSLFFSKVDESHGGEYTCTPFNELGSEGPSTPINVIVQRPPVFTATPHNLYLRKPGENIEIPCDAIDGHSTHRPTIIWFKKDGNPLPEGRSSVSGGNLTITNIGESDRGLYQCVASNEAATISAETEIMIENSLPRAPYNLTAESTFNTITIHWRPAYGRPYMEYSIWYRATDTSEWRTMRVMTRGAMQASISSLSPGREYEIMVLSQDHMGDGMFSKALRVRTKGSAGTFDGSTQDIKNTLGTFQQIGPPIKVQIEVTVDGYHVSWNQPEFGVDLLKYYTVRWYKGLSEHYTDKADTTETSYTVHNLEEESAYHFQILATTTNGYQSTSETFILHVPAYRKTRAISIGIAIGIGFLIAAAVAAFYIRNVNRRTSHKQRELVA